MTPELEFQQHIADFLEREHGYERLGTSAAIDPAEGWMADVLWSFVADTQPQALATLSGQYGSAARDEFFRALREASRQMPLWMLLRNGLMVRGISFGYVTVACGNTPIAARSILSGVSSRRVSSARRQPR